MANVTNSPITTTLGAGGIFAAAVDLVYYAVTQHTVSPNAQMDLSAIFAGVIGVFSKDFNVTGGTKQQ
jgi:hypothetical protein